MTRRKRPATKVRRPAHSGAGRQAAQSKLILLNKPFDVLCQFSDRAPPYRNPDSPQKSDAATRDNTARATLSDYVHVKDVYPAGRLDRDSEGLLLLTNDGKLQSRITEPRFKLPKSYYVQVEGEVTKAAIDKLLTGVDLKDGRAIAVVACETNEPDWLWPRNPPIRYRKTVPDSWINITLTEGRNRQVRRMTAAVGLPTLRLIRYSVGDWTIRSLPPGTWREVPPTQA